MASSARSFVVVALLGGAALVVLALLSAYLEPWMPLSGRAERPGMTDALRSSGDSSLATGDLPAAALVVYGRDIIGRGHNTVRRDNAAGGHAEINAISDALRSVGYDRFWKLRRDSLAIVTLLEPCPMCRGAIVQYNIRVVRILRAKNPITLMGEDLELYRYYWDRVITGPAGMADSLLDLYHSRRP
jgi:tRNA(Arg) A34 adenosine deaminase TadA